MASHVIASALYYLESERQRPDCNHELEILIWIMMHKLRGLRTFVLCSTIAKRNEHTNDCELASSKVPRHKLRVLRRLLLCSSYNMDTSQGSLLVRVEAVVSQILDDPFGPMFSFGPFTLMFSVKVEFHKYLVKMESFQEEINTWYTSLSDYLQISDSPVSINQVKDICDSVLENLDDFLSFHRAYVGILIDQIEALKENITFLTYFIYFATLLRAENQDLHDLLILIQPLVISAAHLTVQLFSASHYNIEALFMDVRNSRRNLSYDGMKSMVSDLLLRIKPVDNPLLYETFFQALESIKSSREMYIPSLDLEKFISFLLSYLWELLQLDTSHVISLKDKLQALYEGLRSLGTMLKKNPSKFDANTRNITGVAIFDAGIVIFSVHRKDFEIDPGVQDFLENIKVIRTEVLEEQAVQTSNFNFPKTNLLGFLDFLLDEMTLVKSCKADSDTQYFVRLIQQDLVYLKSLLEVVVESRQQHKDFQALWDFTAEVAFKIEFLIDQLMLGNFLESFSSSFLSITEDIRVIKTDSMKMISDQRKLIRVQEVSSQYTSFGADEVVGFETERSSIIDRLERGSKTLQVVAIVGMPGLGKTTLALKVYHDPSVRYHFHIRAWCSISQVFNERKVLLELLNHLQPGENSTKNEDDLAQELRHSLLHRRYLIFIDDVWDMQAFNCLKESLPDDSTGSRILLTSRQGDLVPEAILDDKPLFLDQLSPEESLELLQRRLFPARKDWPPPLLEFGNEVARYCKGLPLTIVIVAGILKTTRQEAWKEILVSLRSGIMSTITDECNSSIELSYKHLPDYLKSCFLSFGAFLEDQMIDVKRLIRLWIAEGFVQKSESKSLEEVATDYLDILIGRSLVMTVRERSIGGVKTCRIHDLLHDFCLRKSSEEHFLHVLKKESLPFDETGNLRRLCVHSRAEHFKESKLFCPRLRSLIFCHPTAWNERLDMSFIFHISKLLRVLAIDRIELAHFPNEIGFLVQLRYLAIRVTVEVSSSIGNLTNLETLILYPTRGVIKLPDSFWNLQKLRHLCLSFNSAGIELPVNNLDSSCILLELESLSTIRSDNLDSMEKQLRKCINIRRLKCRISVNGSRVVSFSFLSQLESLSLSSPVSDVYVPELILPQSIKKLILPQSIKKLILPQSIKKLILPQSIKKLTFDMPGLSWDRISSIAELPNLEVLKLYYCSFIADSWHVKEGEFSKLKVLVLNCLDIVNWTAVSDDQFSNLEKLVLYRCQKLEEIPECLENAATLKMIEVRSCSRRVASLFQKIEDFQKDMGNSVLRVHLEDIHEKVSGEEDASGKIHPTDMARLWKRLLRR